MVVTALLGWARVWLVGWRLTRSKGYWQDVIHILLVRVLVRTEKRMKQKALGPGVRLKRRGNERHAFVYM